MTKPKNKRRKKYIPPDMKDPLAKWALEKDPLLKLITEKEKTSFECAHIWDTNGEKCVKCGDKDWMV